MENKNLSGIISALGKVGVIDVLGTESDVDLCEFITDSITFITFIVELENEFQIVFPDNLLLLETVSSLYGLCEIIESLVCNNEKIDLNDDIHDEIEQFRLEINDLKEEMNLLVENTPEVIVKRADLQTQINDLNCQIKDLMCIIQEC